MVPPVRRHWRDLGGLLASHGARWVSRRVGVVLGLYGFVLDVAFGKAYSLVPTYFDRALAGLAGVGLGAWFALGGATEPLIRVHSRLNLAGFLGLTIVGVTTQFYPPAIGTLPGVGDRTALASIVAFGGGLALEVLGVLAALPFLASIGRASALVGAGLDAWMVLALFYERHWAVASHSS